MVLSHLYLGIPTSLSHTQFKDKLTYWNVKVVGNTLVKHMMEYKSSQLTATGIMIISLYQMCWQTYDGMQKFTANRTTYYDNLALSNVLANI